MKSTPSTNPSIRVSPEQLIDNAWLLGLGIMSADDKLITNDFISKTSKLAKNKNIEVEYLDFSQFASPLDAWDSVANKKFRDIVENGTKPSLLWFDHCDNLAPLDCNLTFSIRSKLTTCRDQNIQSIFIASRSSLDLLFNNYNAAFYHANFKITD